MRRATPETVSSQSSSGFDREQSTVSSSVCIDEFQGGFACFGLLDMNRLLTISGLEAILKTPSLAACRQPAIDPDLVSQKGFASFT